MLTGFEALGAASAVLQVISFATDVAVACKNAYDGATTSQDDIQRHAGQMSEAVDRVHIRCEQMSNANSKFASPNLQNIAKECKDAAEKLETEVQYVTGLQVKGDLVTSLRKAFRASRHQKKIQALHESLFMYQQVVITEITSHLCSQSDAIYFQQDASFHKLDTDVQFLISQLAQGITDVKNLVKQEHTVTRNVIIQESARAEVAINSHMDSQVSELRTTAETKRKCEVFLQSLKAPRMNQRYNDVMDSRDASFNQVFATYEDMKTMYHYDTEESGQSTDDDDPEDDPDTGSDSDDTGDVDSGSYESSDAAYYPGYLGDIDAIYCSWDSLNSWLRSEDKLFYIQGKPGSGKSTLVKFILNQDQTNDLIQIWSPDAIIISYFFWKIGSEEQNSIKGLWCSLLYQRLQDQQHLILSTLQHFNNLSSHSEYHDWSIRDLQDVWKYISRLDTRHICMFIDGLDEVRNQDGFSKLGQSIQLISQLPRTKLCVSARPEAQIVRWLQTTKAAGILLEDLTRLDMLQFVRDRFRQILTNNQISSYSIQYLRCKLVHKAQGVFLWLHLATQSIVEGIQNMDSGKMLFERLDALPGDLENLYIDLWQRMNARSPVYVETARRYFRYVLQDPGAPIGIFDGTVWHPHPRPWILQIACAENLEIRGKFLKSTNTLELVEILRICEDTKASIESRCAGLLEVRTNKSKHRLFKRLGDNSNDLGQVAFIHRTAHDFLTHTEAGRGILGCGPLSDFSAETQLLGGLCCAMRVLASEWPLSHTTDRIVEEIANFANRWGSDSLPFAIEMLDIVRPLHDRNFIRFFIPSWAPSFPFLSLLTGGDVFDDFVISRLATETSTGVATSVLRQGWAQDPRTYSFKRLSKRLFFALIKLGADPHEYGIFCHPGTRPFATKATAFTNLLVSFIFATKFPDEKHPRRIDDESRRKTLLETLEIAIYLVTTCQNLNAGVSLFSHISPTGRVAMVPCVEALAGLRVPPYTPYTTIVYEVDIKFLFSHLLWKVRGILADWALLAPQFKDILSRIDRPLVQIRYFQRPVSEQPIPPGLKFQRILSPEPLPISHIERLFDVDFNRISPYLRKPYEDKNYLDAINQYIKDVETEEVNVEDMMTCLATENLGISTYEEAGVIPPYDHLRSGRKMDDSTWMLFPLSMGRLEAAAAIKEGIQGHE